MRARTNILLGLFAVAIVSVALIFFGSLGNGVAEVSRYRLDSGRLREDGVLTMLTYNVGYFSGLANEGLRVAGDAPEGAPLPDSFDRSLLDRAVQGLKPLAVDVLAVQEIDVDSDRSGRVDQPRALAEGLGLSHAHFSVNWDKRFIPYPLASPSRWIGRVVSGQAVFSTYPLEEIESVLLERPSHDFLTDLFYFDRRAQVVKVTVDGRDTYVLNVHLEAFDAETNLRQAKEVLRLYSRYRELGPTLLVGDFNNDISEETLNLFLREETIVAVPVTDPTYPSFNPTVRVDHIFYSPDDFCLLESGVLSAVNAPSDHLPVFARFALSCDGPER